MLPIRCFSCNKIIGCYNSIFENYLKTNNNYQFFFEKYNISRYCCRKIFLTHVDIYQYKPNFPHDNIICKDTSEIKKIIKSE